MLRGRARPREEGIPEGVQGKPRREAWGPGRALCQGFQFTPMRTVGTKRGWPTAASAFAQV
jgi:hypothetical protein